MEIKKSAFADFFCRDDKIRTCGLFVPNEARYRAALHPEPDFFGLQKYNFFLFDKGF